MASEHQVTALPSEMPDEFRRWHWGAFILSWIWGLANGTYLALLALAPWLLFSTLWERLDFPFDWIVCFGLVLIVPLVLGRYGHALAWRNRRWSSVEEFRRVQDGWSRWGKILVVGWIVLSAVIGGGVFYALRSSVAYEAGMRRLQESAEVADLLGRPLEFGRFPMGRIAVANDAGSAALTFPVSGPKGRGRVLVEATKRAGTWSLDRLLLQLEGREGVIDVLRGADRRAARALPARPVRS